MPDADAFEEQFSKHQLAVGRVRQPGELTDTEWARERHAVVDVDDRGGGTIRVPNSPWRFSSSPDVGVSGIPKYRGEDNRSLLTELLGYDDARLDELEAERRAVEPSPRRPDTHCRRDTPVPRPADEGDDGVARRDPEGDGWAFEVKWDGYRTIVHVADGAVRLQSTAGHDVTPRWPEFADLADSVNASSAILDGELVVFDDDGRPRFELVQNSRASDRRVRPCSSSSTCCTSMGPT